MGSKYKKEPITAYPVVLTRHARERLDEFGVSYRDGVNMLKQATEEKAPSSKWKREKYGSKQEGIRYFRNGRLIYIVQLGINLGSPKKEQAFIVITVTDQLINLKGDYV